MREVAAWLLGGLRESATPRTGIALAAAFKNDKENGVRRAAGCSLCNFCSPALLPCMHVMVEALSEERDSKLRCVAVQFLATLGPSAAEHADLLMNILSGDSAAEVRASAATALGQLGLRHASQANAFAEALLDPALNVRHTALETLRSLGETAESNAADFLIGLACDCMSSATRRVLAIEGLHMLTKPRSASGGIFGAAPGAASSGGIFGAPAAPVSSGGLFGASIFGGGGADSSLGGIFGAAPGVPTPGGIFGGAAAPISSGRIFGAGRTDVQPIVRLLEPRVKALTQLSADESVHHDVRFAASKLLYQYLGESDNHLTRWLMMWQAQI